MNSILPERWIIPVLLAFVFSTISSSMGTFSRLQAAEQDAADPTPRRPNVILIMSDDQGSVDLQCYGARDLHTPNLDALAKRGVRFTQHYVGAPVCTPSRGCLLTGRYAQRNGADRNGRSFKPDEITLAEMFKSAGYRTGLVGKWHLGEAPGPNGEGFDSFFGHLGGCIENYHHDNYKWSTGEKRQHDLWRDQEPVHEDDVHFGELIVREATGFIERNKEVPFFLYVTFNSPHYPVQPLPEHLERYKDEKEPRRSYAAFVSTLDDQVGKIIDKIDALGLRENTLIVFLSDHGHSTEPNNNLWLKDADPRRAGGGSAGPYRGCKFTLWEGGIRVPCMVSLPGVIPEDEVRAQMVTSLDWLPTIAEYCKVPLPARKLDGTSIASVIANPEARSPHPIWHWMSGKRWAVRKGKWKLVYDRRLFLADLDADVSEKTNLLRQHPDIAIDLHELHDEWLIKVNARK